MVDGLMANPSYGPSRRIEFVIPRTASSPQIALHPASRRRGNLRLRAWSTPTRTCTVLCVRPHGRTGSGL
jgi:hypothetical protein